MKNIMKKLLPLTFLCGLLTVPALHGAAASSNENTMNENTIEQAIARASDSRDARELEELYAQLLGQNQDDLADRVSNALQQLYALIYPTYDPSALLTQRLARWKQLAADIAKVGAAAEEPTPEPEVVKAESIEGNITLIGRNGRVDLSADSAQQHSGFIRRIIAFNKASEKDFRNISLPNYDKNLLQLIAKLITLRSENVSLRSLAQTLKESNADFNQVLQLADYLNLDKKIIQAIEYVEGNITLIGRDGTANLSADAAQQYSGFIRRIIAFNKASEKDFRNISLPNYDKNLLQLIAKLITLRSENVSLQKLAQTLEESNADFNQILQLADYLNLDNKIIQAIGLAYAPAIIEEYQNQIASVSRAFGVPRISTAQSFDWPAILTNQNPDIQQLIIPFIADAYMNTVNNDINKLPVDLKSYAIQKTNDALLADRSFLHRINTPQHSLARLIPSNITLAFSPDGKQLASGSWDGVKIRNPRNWTERPVALTDHTEQVNSVAFSPDGKQLASGSGDRTIKIWNPRNWTEQPVTLTGHTGPVYSLAFNPDGSQLASGSRGDNTVKIWNPRNPDEQPVILTGHTNTVSSLAFSPDGSQLATGSWDRTIKIWNPRNWTEQPVTLTGHTGPVYSLAFNPDGSQLATGSRGDNTVKIWNPRNPDEQPVILTGHTSTVSSLAFSPDGKQLTSSSWDSTIRIWNPRNWTEQPVTLAGAEPILSLAFSPDGSQLASGLSSTVGSNTLKIWAMPNSIALPYHQFDLVKRAAPAWARNEPFVINNAEDLETYNELPERYRDERLFTLPVQAASSSGPVGEATSSSAAASSSE